MGPQRSRRQRARATKVEGADATFSSALPPSPASPTHDRRSVAVGLLRDGFVQSFVDIFYLFHDESPSSGKAEAGSLAADPLRPPTAAAAAAEARDEGEYKHGEAGSSAAAPSRGSPASASDLIYVRTCLAEAEAATRAQRKLAVMENYTRLADHFGARHQAKTALYFRTKAAEVARLTDDVLEEPKALLSLGVTELAEGEAHRAVRTLEGCLDLVSEHMRATDVKPGVADQLTAMRSKAHSLLLEAYAASSGALSAGGDLADALAAELRALQVAQEAGDKAAEAAAQLRAGKLCLRLERPAKALTYLRNYMALFGEAQRDGREMAGSETAFSALAEAYELSGRPDEALATLGQFAEASERIGDSLSVAEARQRLGVAQLRRGRTAKAVTELQQSFEVRRALVGQGTGQRSDLAAARVSLGLARASASSRDLIRVVATDLSALLEWKTHRAASALAAPEAATAPAAATAAAAGDA